MTRGQLRNCLITGNHAARSTAGGVLASSGSIIDSCTVAKNSAPQNGGGVYLTGDAQMRNSIVFDNESSGAKNVYISGASAAAEYVCSDGVLPERPTLRETHTTPTRRTAISAFFPGRHAGMSA